VGVVGKAEVPPMGKMVSMQNMVVVVALVVDFLVMLVVLGVPRCLVQEEAVVEAG
jgi:hypothetical protein